MQGENGAGGQGAGEQGAGGAEGSRELLTVTIRLSPRAVTVAVPVANI